MTVCLDTANLDSDSHSRCSSSASAFAFASATGNASRYAITLSRGTDRTSDIASSVQLTGEPRVLERLPAGL